MTEASNKTCLDCENYRAYSVKGTNGIMRLMEYCSHSHWGSDDSPPHCFRINCEDFMEIKDAENK